MFRANLWSVGLHDSHQLSRVSYRVLPRTHLEKPVVVLISRLVCMSWHGQKLHEELLYTGGEFRESEISTAQPEHLRQLLDIPGTHPPLPTDIANLLRKFFPGHEKALSELLEQRVADTDKGVRTALRQLATEHAAQTRKLIDERVKEIGRRIQAMDAELDSAQLKLFDEPERDQYHRDLAWLRGRLEQLKGERETEPEALKARYSLRGAPRAFPLALLYLLPDKLLK